MLSAVDAWDENRQAYIEEKLRIVDAEMKQYKAEVERTRAAHHRKQKRGKGHTECFMEETKSPAERELHRLSKKSFARERRSERVVQLMR